MSSVAFDKIVPFGQVFVLDDIPFTLTLKERVAFFLCLIYVSVDSRKYSKSRLGCRLGSHITGFLDGVEDGSAPYSGNLNVIFSFCREINGEKKNFCLVTNPRKKLKYRMFTGAES